MLLRFHKVCLPLLAITAIAAQAASSPGADTSAQKNHTVFLCVDSMLALKKATGQVPPKLVYTYVNGVKTECMPEADFRMKYVLTESEKPAVAEVDSQKLLEERGLKRKLPRLNPLESALKGRKDLAGVDLAGTDLRGVNLENADLRKAKLDYADLRGANLKNAKLQGASLEGAYLKDANLDGANVEGASFKGAYLHFANLNNIEGMNIETIRFSRTVYSAQMDTVFLESVKEYCPNKLIDPGWQWDTGKYTNPESPPVEKADRKKFR